MCIYISVYIYVYIYLVHRLRSCFARDADFRNKTAVSHCYISSHTNIAPAHEGLTGVPNGY